MTGYLSCFLYVSTLVRNGVRRSVRSNCPSPVTLAHSKEWRSYKLMKLLNIGDNSVHSVSFGSTCASENAVLARASHSIGDLWNIPMKF